MITRLIAWCSNRLSNRTRRIFRFLFRALSRCRPAARSHMSLTRLAVYFVIIWLGDARAECLCEYPWLRRPLGQLVNGSGWTCTSVNGRCVGPSEDCLCDPDWEGDLCWTRKPHAFAFFAHGLLTDGFFQARSTLRSAASVNRSWSNFLAVSIFNPRCRSNFCTSFATCPTRLMTLRRFQLSTRGDRAAAIRASFALYHFAPIGLPFSTICGRFSSLLFPCMAWPTGCFTR